MRIALYGIHGLYNYGCEAIVRGAYQLFASAFPDSEITYYSYHPQEDALQISDIPVAVKPIKTNDSVLRRGVNKVLKTMNIDTRLPRFDYSGIVDSNDLVVSIGGDIYTIPEHIRSQKVYGHYSPLVQFGDYVKRRGKKLIIYGASIGPFGKDGKAVAYYKKHLQSVDCIIAREHECVDYLKRIGVKDNVIFMPDPIFAIPYREQHIDKEDAIAINLSPLSAREIMGTAEGTERSMASLITRLYQATKCELVLVPHVFSSDSRDNDYEYLENVIAYLDEVTRNHVRLTKPESLFDASAILAKCKVAVAARMHCALNAAMSGTLPLFLAYSSKAEGMAELVYCDRNWVVPLKSVEMIEDRVKALLSNLDVIGDVMTSNVQKYRKGYTSGECSTQLKAAFSQDG